jgi:predicted amidophosphoribosyltransferase
MSQRNKNEYEVYYNEHLDFALLVSEKKTKLEKDVDCYKCFNNNTYNCKTCPILDSEYFINWDEDIKRTLPPIKEVTSPFWIVPRQSHWYYNSISDHKISEMFYRFKSGNKHYARMFAFGILKAIKENNRLANVNFDYILGIPLSPEKKDNYEFDRVSELCKIISKEMNVAFIKDGLSLTEPISRRDYKLSGREKEFFIDYYKFLEINTPDLNNRNILLIDDVFTEGETLRATSYKINDCYSHSRIYAATGGIMAKKSNMKFKEVLNFKK